jgi:hypothetical protein
MLQRLAQERGQGDQVHVWNHRMAQGIAFRLPRFLGIFSPFISCANRAMPDVGELAGCLMILS